MLTYSLRSEAERTIFSVRDPADGTVTLRAERPALLLSSTSWTGLRKRRFPPFKNENHGELLVFSDCKPIFCVAFAVRTFPLKSFISGVQKVLFLISQAFTFLQRLTHRQLHCRVFNHISMIRKKQKQNRSYCLEVVTSASAASSARSGFTGKDFGSDGFALSPAVNLGRDRDLSAKINKVFSWKRGIKLPVFLIIDVNTMRECRDARGRSLKVSGCSFYCKQNVKFSKFSQFHFILHLVFHLWKH